MPRLSYEDIILVEYSNTLEFADCGIIGLLILHH